MPAYAVFDLSPLDPDKMKHYLDVATSVLKSFDGKIIAASNDVDMREGDWSPERIVIVEFPTMAAAQGWYESPEYQGVLPMRLRVNHHDKMVIVPGIA